MTAISNCIRLRIASLFTKWADALNGVDASSEDKQLNIEGQKSNPEARNSAPMTRTIIDIPEVILEEYRRNQKENASNERSSRKIAIGAVLGAYVLAAIGIWQAHLTNVANELTRETYSDTQGAIVEMLQASPYFNPSSGISELDFTNSGKVTAADFTGWISLARIYLPSFAPIERPTTCNFGGQGTHVVPTSPPITIPFSVTCGGRGFVAIDTNSNLRELREAVVINGAFDYLNGIDTIQRHDDFCWILFDPALVPQSEGFGSGSSSSFSELPCRFKSRIIEIAAKVQKKQDHNQEETRSIF